MGRPIYPSLSTRTINLPTHTSAASLRASASALTVSLALFGAVDTASGQLSGPLAEHPAVQVPARANAEDHASDEHPAVAVRRRAAAIDPNRFIVGHPASPSWARGPEDGAGDPALALERSRAATSAAAAEATARAGLAAYLSLWSADRVAGDVSALSPDFVLRYAHSVPELLGEVHGRESAVDRTRALARLGRQWAFRDVRLFPTLQRDVYFAQYTATGISAIDGAAIERNVVLRLDLDRQHVVRLVEYANPAAGLAVEVHGRLAPGS